MAIIARLNNWFCFLIKLIILSYVKNLPFATFCHGGKLRCTIVRIVLYGYVLSNSRFAFCRLHNHALIYVDGSECASFEEVHVSMISIRSCACLILALLGVDFSHYFNSRCNIYELCPNYRPFALIVKNKVFLVKRFSLQCVIFVLVKKWKSVQIP